MLLHEFECIANERAELRVELELIQEQFAQRPVGVPIRLTDLTDFVGIAPERLARILQQVPNTLLGTRDCFLCAKHEPEALLTDAPVDGRVNCDLCGGNLEISTLGSETCYVLVRPVTFARTAGNPYRKGGLLSLAEWCQIHRIEPWTELAEREYLIPVKQLGESDRQLALDRLERFGVALLRWEGDIPVAERIESFESWLGPARREQNDYQGKVKTILPQPGVEANTGDSASELAPHVDGTQDEDTPAILIFQYLFEPTWGGDSTFIDTAGLLASMDEREVESVLLALSRRDAATCVKEKQTGKWKRAYYGPLVKSVMHSRSLALRLRLDDVMTVIPECQWAFDRLKDEVRNWRHRLVYMPKMGDIVVFDNWRLLHGRLSLGGRAQRGHQRMWVDSLLPKHQPHRLLGIRPLSHALMAAVERGNDPSKG